MRALIAEDDFTSRLLMQKLLAPYGEVHVAINGREALEAFTAGQAQAAALRSDLPGHHDAGNGRADGLREIRDDRGRGARSSSAVG